MSRRRAAFLWGMLALYTVGRFLQLYAGQLPSLLIAALQVVPPALFALAHGSILYRPKGIAVFTALCIGIGGLAESLSLRTGFPFGHYHFTDLMGPKIFELPVLLALAYLGMGYAAWILALLILGYDHKPIGREGTVLLPLVASSGMLAWDLSMDPAWSALDRAWIWHDGGAYFGVPLSNFGGWFFTAYLYYQAFTLYCRRSRPLAAHPRPSLWFPVILLYVLCALGNLVILGQPLTPEYVIDATGAQWPTIAILWSCVLVSLVGMLPFAIFAWFRSRQEAHRHLTRERALT